MIDLTKRKLAESNSIPASDGTYQTVRSNKSVSNRSRGSAAKSFNSRKSNKVRRDQYCSNDFVLVGGVGLDNIDVNLSRTMKK
jgi:hypothetical protein